MTKTKQRILKEFDTLWSEFVMKLDNEYTIFELEEDVKSFLSQAIDKMREEMIEEINDRIMNWFEGHQEVTLEDRLELRGLLKKLKNNG